MFWYDCPKVERDMWPNENEPCNSVKGHTLLIFVLSGYQNFDLDTPIRHIGSRY